MNIILLVFVPLVLYLLAYHTYGRYIASKVFKINERAKVPSELQQDGSDYVPTKKSVLFGHHFTTIAGLGPIAGPAVAMIWGWLPALIWVVLGSIFMGAVHDFGSLIISMRNRGKSVGDIAKQLVGPRIAIIFKVIIFLSLWIVIAVFAFVIAALFSMYPAAVWPVWLQIPLALGLGYAMNRRGMNSVIAGLIALGLMYLGIYVFSGSTKMESQILGLDPLVFWMIILMIYAYVASTIPVQMLLQPRDYINSYQLIVAMVLISLAVLVSNPEVTVPAINTADTGSPALFPFLFVIIACGAVSGFHSLASSGTTSKQCANEADAKPIGYGGMLTEAFLATLVIACIAGGLGYGIDEHGNALGAAAFQDRFASWGDAKGLAAKLGNFVDGAANMMGAIGVSKELAQTLLGVFLVSFAATTLDSATRIQRYVIAELAVTCRAKPLAQKHPATILAVLTAFILVFHRGFDPAAAKQGSLMLWPLFGCINQLLASLAFTVLTLYLIRKRSNVFVTLVPMVFMVSMTSWALYETLFQFFNGEQYLLLAVGLLVSILMVWMLIESVIAMLRTYKNPDQVVAETTGVELDTDGCPAC